jgi:tricorn protease
MKRLLFTLLISAAAFAANSQTNALWLRYPSLSPDGKTIAFGYKGDIYRVDVNGGTAVALTIHEAQDMMPVWSNDGKTIAFASDRYGNFDVYTIPAEGGEATRLTFHSVNDLPWEFSKDNKTVYFGSGRNDPGTSVRFPRGNVFMKLFAVPAKGGRSVLVNSAGMEFAHFSKNGDKIVFQDKKGGEDNYRKHHTSSITRDIWVYDTKTKEYKQVSTFNGEDREPQFSADDKNVFYLSEKNGSQNLYKMVLDGGAEKQLTKFKDHPVRNLTRSNDNTLCFTWNGEVYTMKEGSEPQKLNVNVIGDARTNSEKIVSVNGGSNEVEASPNGKEIAFVFRGEVFVTSVEGGITKRITNTPQQERNVEWSADGRTLYYATERGATWDIYSSSIIRKDEPYFYASTVLKEEPVIATDKEEFAPDVSPDGKELAYLEERNILRVFNLQNKTSRTIIPAGQNFSYADGDQSFSWSPDSKWIAARSSKGRYGAAEVVIFNTSGNDKGIDLTQSGFSDGGQSWAMNGKMLVWASDKEGKKPLAYQGAREVDLYAMFFDKDSYDRFRLSKDEYALVKERDDKDAKEKKDSVKKKEAYMPDFNSVDGRKVKLTNGSLNLGGYTLSPTADKLFFTARFEQGYDLWVLDTRTKELKSLAKLAANNASLDISGDGKSLFVLADGRISKVDAESGKVTPVSINSEMVLNAAGEREYIFNHAWRQVKKKFYDPKLHGADWEMYKNAYARFLPHISNNYDFQELLSEMLGELNASHTGGRYSPQFPNADVTASLGLLYDETIGGNGLKITEVLEGGPIDKFVSKIKAGNIIEQIDGEMITDNADWARLLNRKVNKNVLLSVFDPATNMRWEEIVKPVSLGEENALLYKRWTTAMAKMVDKLSNGQVGYVHVQAMSDASYRNVYEEVLGKNADKKALIVDTRFNGGGWLHEDLSNFLSGKQYIKFAPYGFSAEGGEPQGKWFKPSAVVVNEANYSDAHTFPYAYRAKGIGPLIGMPVHGTSTSVWWETQIDPTMVFGIPMIANIGIKEGRPLENFQLEPDIKVANEYNLSLNGRDQQIEAAVKEMLKKINRD